MGGGWKEEFQEVDASCTREEGRGAGADCKGSKGGAGKRPLLGLSWKLLDFHLGGGL